MESRVCQNTDRLLGIFEHAGVHATFFVLGWVAERFPELVQRIHRAGHELASHSHEHGLVYDSTPEAFRARFVARQVGHRKRGRRSRIYGYQSTELLDYRAIALGASTCS